MGKYYSRHGRNLYIYVTQDDVMIDLGFFPKELNLFDTEAAWLIRNKMAVVSDADETSVDKAENILSLNSFRRWDHPQELLEQYFTLGDESILGEKVVAIPEIAPTPAEESMLNEMEVIIPRAIASPPGSQAVVSKGQEEVVVFRGDGRNVESHMPEHDDALQGKFDLATELMTDDIKEFTYKAYSSYSGDVGQNLTDWFKHIEAHWKKLEPVLEMIATSPHYIPSTRKVKKQINEVEELDPKTIDSIMRELSESENQEEREAFFRRLISGLPLRVSVKEEHPDYDIVENRVLKTHLDVLVSRLGQLFELTLTRDNYLRIGVKRSEGEAMVERAKEFLANHEIMGEINKLKENIAGLLKEPKMAFLEQLKQLSGPITSTQIFSNHPHYSRFYTTLESYEDSAPPPPFRFEFNVEKVLVSSNIYATWCMVKILEALIEIGYKLKIKSLTWLTGDDTGVEEGINIVLTGKDSEVKLAHEKIYIRQPPYGSYSSPKKATLALEIFRGDIVPKVIVFEPRYDFEYSADRFMVDDLDKLHVLRDSIVDLRNDEHDRIVMGGIVLHPALAETVRYDDLAGISLRPSTTGNPLVEIIGEFLDTV